MLLLFNTPFTRYNRLSERLYNRYDNRLDVCLHNAAGCPVVQPAVQLNSRLYNRFDNRLDVCIHDTTCCPTGCQTGLTAGLTTGCIV